MYYKELLMVVCGHWNPWTPVTGNVNYTTNGVIATPHNHLTAAGATPHLIKGTPGIGQIRLGK